MDSSAYPIDIHVHGMRPNICVLIVKYVGRYCIADLDGTLTLCPDHINNTVAENNVSSGVVEGGIHILSSVREAITCLMRKEMLMTAPFFMCWWR